MNRDPGEARMEPCGYLRGGGKAFQAEGTEQAKTGSHPRHSGAAVAGRPMDGREGGEGGKEAPGVRSLPGDFDSRSEGEGKQEEVWAERGRDLVQVQGAPPVCCAESSRSCTGAQPPRLDNARSQHQPARTSKGALVGRGVGCVPGADCTHHIQGPFPVPPRWEVGRVSRTTPH